ncbi:MAG: c-type cytochrome [Paracoccaceae bacterium]
MRNQLQMTAALVALGLSINAASAQDTERGRQEYMQSCAVCHGESGKGDGQLAEIMTVPVPDLTQISARHDGKFPILDIFMIIDGRTGVRGHGYPMPVWGARYKAEEAHRSAMGAEISVRARLLELTYYLQTIQE